MPNCVHQNPIYFSTEGLQVTTDYSSLGSSAQLPGYKLAVQCVYAKSEYCIFCEKYKKLRKIYLH